MPSATWIVTDLDHTLLDDHYTVRGAEAVLARLQDLRIPLIAATTKTRAELEGLRQELPLSAAIYEDGGGFMVREADGAWTHTALGVDHQTIREALASLPEEIVWSGFADLSLEQLAAETGLSDVSVRAAARREHSEQIRLGKGSSLRDLRSALDPARFLAIPGGRYISVHGLHDKGTGLDAFIKAEKLPKPERIIALGDAVVDLPILDRADVACYMPSLREHALPDWVPIAPSSPAGWAIAVTEALSRLG